MALLDESNRDTSNELEQLFKTKDNHSHNSSHKNDSCSSRPSSPRTPLVFEAPSLSPICEENPRFKKRRTRHDSDNSSSSSTSSSSSGGRKKRQPPPDGGWGWMVVLASFGINLISDGVSLSFGLFLPDLTNYFAVGRGHAAWVASLFLSMPLLAGPIASWVTDRYGCRKVCIVGSLLATLGFVLSYLSNSLFLLYVTFSIAGFGLALCYVTSIVIVAYYFEKKRCLATGLSVCGTGVGTFIFAPLTNWLVEEYTWRGTLLILAGFFLNMVASGALMRDLDEEEEDKTPSSPATTAKSSQVSVKWDSMGNLEEGSRRMCSSLLQLPTYMSKESPRLPAQVLSEMSSNERGHLSLLLEKYPTLWNDVISNDDPYLTVKSSPVIKTIMEGRTLDISSSHLTLPDPERTIKFADSDAIDKSDCVVSVVGGNAETGNGMVKSSLACAASSKKSSSLRQHRQAGSMGPLAFRDRANSAAYLRNLRLQRGSLTYKGAMLNIRRYRLKASSCPNIYRNSMTTINDNESSPCEFLQDLKDVLCDMMDVRLLTNFKYALFCLSNFLLNACVDNPYVYIPDHAASLPLIKKESGAYIISIVGVLNTLGVVMVGYVGDKPWIDPSLLYAMCTIIAGASVALIPLLSTYLTLAAASAVYGFTISANYTLVPEIVVNLISLDNFTGAYGLLLLIQGIAGLIGPPIAGWLYDISGSYDTTFYLSGLCILASGILVIPVAQTCKCSCTEAPDPEPDSIVKSSNNSSSLNVCSEQGVANHKANQVRFSLDI